MAATLEALERNPLAGILRSPDLSRFAFFPQRSPEPSWDPELRTGTYPGGEGHRIGWLFRAAPLQPARATIVCFHGNGEIALTYVITGLLRREDINILAVDFAGYGFSDGAPTILGILRDAHEFGNHIDGILAAAGAADPPVVIFGRSIGSAAAVQLALARPSRFAGLALDSPIGRLFELPMTRMLVSNVPMLGSMLDAGIIPDPYDNIAKSGELSLPLLVVHGEEVRGSQRGPRRTCRARRTCRTRRTRHACVRRTRSAPCTTAPPSTTVPGRPSTSSASSTSPPPGTTTSAVSTPNATRAPSRSSWTWP